MNHSNKTHHHHSDSKNTSDINVICTHCVIHDSGQESIDPKIRERANRLDFSSDGPPMPICQICKTPCKDWATLPEHWDLLPEQYRSLPICPADFLKLLKGAGHDTTGIEISYVPWKWKLEMWKDRNSAPKHKTHIRITDGEVMNCEVLEIKDDDTFVVELTNSSILKPSMKKGTLIIAKWNGSLLHGVSGRPILTPIARLKRKKASRPIRQAKK